MKFLLAALFLINLTHSYSAETVTIICDRPGVNTSNQFDLIGTAQIAEDGVSTSAVVQINTRKQGRDSDEQMHVAEMFGKLKTFAPGAMGMEEVVHLQYIDKGAEVEYLSIVGNHPGVFSSQVRMNNGVTYKSKCYVK